MGCTAILFGTACMGAVKYVPENMKVELSLKVPGNNACLLYTSDAADE